MSVDLRPFLAGIQAARASLPCHDPRSAFLSVLNENGFRCNDVRMDTIVRIDSPNDKVAGKKSGWYAYRELADEDGSLIGLGVYGCWKEGTKTNWQSKLDHAMTSNERVRFHMAKESMRAQYEAEKKKSNLEAASRAFELWSNAANATTDHPYISRKQISVRQGVKISEDGRLILPVVRDNQIISLQFIADDGEKRFLRGSTTIGGYFKIEGQGERVYVAEGYATADSIHMATGATVYIAFSSHNMTETALTAKAENPHSIVVIAGDMGNGSKDAMRAADAIQSTSIFTNEMTAKDFNDYHVRYGLEKLKLLFIASEKDVYIKKEQAGGAANEMDYQPTGFLLDVYNYYNATSGNTQHGFAIQTALAIASVVCGRAYKTNYNNYPALYFMSVGKTGTGKEHPKTVIESILYSAGMGDLVAGDGYTSAGAVFTALMDRPRHVTVIDEMGRYLEAGRSSSAAGGSHHQREANTKIMEAFGRCHNVMRPAVYSAMTQTKDMAEKLKSRQVHNPSITIIGMSVPETLFKALDMGAIKDGFVNRFVIHVSDAERKIRKHKENIQVPIRIIDWIERITYRYSRNHSAADPSEAITLEFTPEADEYQEQFQQYCIDKANELEKFGMAEITGRANEIAMRIALICALSEKPEATEIDRRHIEWASEYVKQNMEDTISRLKISISSSNYEGDKKEILAALRERGSEGMKWSDMQKQLPFSKHKQKDLSDILKALKDADLVDEEPIKQKKGRPTVIWYALN